jgi:hypothetical protein
VPKGASFLNQFESGKKKLNNTKIYVRRVLTTENCEDLSPEWLSFTCNVIQTNQVFFVLRAICALVGPFQKALLALSSAIPIMSPSSSAPSETPTSTTPTKYHSSSTPYTSPSASIRAFRIGRIFRSCQFYLFLHAVHLKVRAYARTAPKPCDTKRSKTADGEQAALADPVARTLGRPLVRIENATRGIQKVACVRYSIAIRIYELSQFAIVELFLEISLI